MSQALENADHQIDTSAASQFLKIFDLGERVDYRCFDDDKTRNLAASNYAFRSLNRRDLFQLVRKNYAGFGVFWIPNAGGPKDADIVRIRAVFVDYDADDLAGFEARLSTMPTPHAIVESSPGKRHVYWAVQGVPVDQFQPIQKALITKLQTDRSIHNPSRVMRLPGFLHQKRKKDGDIAAPFLSRVIGGEPKREAYTLAEVRAMSGVDNVVPMPAKTRQRPATVAAAVAHAAPMTARERTCAQREEEYDRACVLSALAYLADNGQAEDHADWQAVGACLRGATRPTGGKPALLSDDEALQLFDQFSARAANYDPDGLVARWDGLGNAIAGIGSLLARAQLLGWKQPDRAPPARRAMTGRGGEAAPAPADTPSNDLDWTNRLDVTAKGEIYSTLANTCVMLENAPDLKGVFAYDKTARDIVLCRRFGEGSKPFAKPRRLDDEAISEAIRRLNQHGLRKVSSEIAHRAAQLVAQRNAVDPLRDYLRGLVWDGTPRIDRWLVTYLEAPDTAYTRAIGRMWMIGAVSRAIRPGCKNDYMLVLQGAQGAGKSSALAVLGGDWFSDQLPDVKNRKEAAQHLRGVWIAEIAELSATRKADAEALKHFITTTTEKYRPPYGRVEVEEPRTCVLIGTTNEETFLRDTTGNRRFWPVATGSVHVEELKRDRDQLWAEAVMAFRNREPSYPDRNFEREHIAPAQAACEEVDPWESIIAEAVEKEREASARNGEAFRITAQTIAEKYLRIERGRSTIGEGRRIAAAMKRLGLARKQSNGVRYFTDPT